MAQPDLPACIAALEAFPITLASLLADVTPKEAKRRGAKKQWSIIEIINHLADEEAEDFRTRLRLTLEDPQQEWPAIDPEAAAAERDYNSRDLMESLGRFATERKASVKWLRTLTGQENDWAALHPHPEWPTSAGDLLASWMAHDMLHLRQLAKRLHELAAIRSGGYDPSYAGPLTP